MSLKQEIKLLEINNGTFYRGSRVGSKENCYEIARLCKKHKVPVIVGIDSHFAFDVGRFDKVIELLRAIEMPEELIMNTSVERFKTILNKRGKKDIVNQNMQFHIVITKKIVIIQR